MSNMLFFDNSNLKEEVLSRVNEFELFSYALNIQIDELISTIYTNTRLFNPKAITHTPSLGFSLRRRTNGATYLYCKDFANDRYSGDAISSVANKLNLNCNKNVDFVKTLKHILENIDSIKKEHHLPKDIYDCIERSYIINYREFKGIDVNYFAKYDLRISDFNDIDYRPIASIYDNIEGKFIYMFRNTNIAYSYITGITSGISKKIYFPYNKLNRFKVINGSAIFEDPNLYNEDNRHKILIITKSRKDKLILQKHIFKLNRDDIYVTNISSESTIFDDEIDTLYTFYTAIYTFFDLDKTGVQASIRYRKLGILSLLPNHGFIKLDNISNLDSVIKCKDYSDTVATNIQVALNILEKILSYI